MKQTLQANNLNRRRDYGYGEVTRESFQVNSGDEFWNAKGKDATSVVRERVEAGRDSERYGGR
jgi:hypothetical protein